jgi:hypothetical protein
MLKQTKAYIWVFFILTDYKVIINDGNAVHTTISVVLSGGGFKGVGE